MSSVRSQGHVADEGVLFPLFCPYCEIETFLKISAFVTRCKDVDRRSHRAAPRLPFMKTRPFVDQDGSHGYGSEFFDEFVA